MAFTTKSKDSPDAPKLRKRVANSDDTINIYLKLNDPNVGLRDHTLGLYVYKEGHSDETVAREVNPKLGGSSTAHVRKTAKSADGSVRFGEITPHRVPSADKIKAQDERIRELEDALNKMAISLVKIAERFATEDEQPPKNTPRHQTILHYAGVSINGGKGPQDRTHTQSGDYK